MQVTVPRRERRNSNNQPNVGIFWLVDGKLLIDSTPLSQGARYGDYLTHPRGHDAVWEQWQRIGRVPADLPYLTEPRGRVMFNSKAKEFVLLADKCILDRKDLIAQIKDALQLPRKITLGTDEHYRCAKCLYGEGTDADWDF